MSVFVVYVDKKGDVFWQTLPFYHGMTLWSALEQTSFLALPAFDWLNDWLTDHQNQPINQKAWYVGVFSQKKALTDLLNDGDRVEIYRPLSNDPMVSRQQKATKTRQASNKTNQYNKTTNTTKPTNTAQTNPKPN